MLYLLQELQFTSRKWVLFNFSNEIFDFNNTLHKSLLKTDFRDDGVVKVVALNCFFLAWRLTTRACFCF